ncbi:hypothetical protein HWV62_42530 [Athelia sp. TMB]|nr:hypothetical protein HWV62_42530 [Athelia sp. TMB]
MSNLRAQTIDWPLGPLPNWEKNDSGEAAGEEAGGHSGLKSVADSASWQATTPYGVSTYAPHASAMTTGDTTKIPSPIAASVEAVVSQQSSSPLFSSLGAEVDITPELITQVNIAAASNPTLANLLQLAASGQATPDQLQTLGLLIQSLASISSHDKSSVPSRSASIFGSGTPQPDETHQVSTPALAYNTMKAPSMYPAYRSFKEFDIVLEFAENPSDRWILPRSPSIIESDPGVKTDDLLLTVAIPFHGHPLQTAHSTNPDEGMAQHVVTFRFARASNDIQECLSRWNDCQGSIEITRKALKQIASSLLGGSRFNPNNLIARQSTS